MCHPKCGVPDSGSREDCNRMDDTGHCTKCKCKGHWTMHYNYRKTEPIMEYVTEVTEDPVMKKHI